MTFAITPVAEGQGMTVTEEMRKDAKLAGASIEAGGRLPGLYLMQSSGDLVKEGKAADKEWVISSGDDDPVNVGPNPLFIVLTAQTRYRYSVEDEKEDKQRIIWDAAKGALTAKQDADVMAKRAKRYTAFILVHVGTEGIDPHKLGPISYAAKGMSCLAGIKWSDAVANVTFQGIPQFTVCWRLGSKLEKAVTGKGSWNVLTHEGPMKMTLDAKTYAGLKNLWLLADGKRKHDEGVVHTGAASVDDDALAAQADAEAEIIKDAIVVEDDPTLNADYVPGNSGYDDYATSLPTTTRLPATIPQEAVVQKIDFSTPIACGHDDGGQVIKAAAEDMSAGQCQAAYDIAVKYPDNARARAVCVLMDALAGANGWLLTKF
jgi:hypothetical protein